MTKKITASQLPSLEAIKDTVNDPARLDVVRNNLLSQKHVAGDDPTDATLQELSRRGSAALNAPLTLISLVEAEHDIIGGEIGIPNEAAPNHQIDAQPSFCELTVTAGQPVIIEDTLEVPTLRLFPSVVENGVRAHLGIPLRVNGQPVGNFCVIDFKPRQWSDDDVATLRDLADEAAARLTELQQ